MRATGIGKAEQNKKEKREALLNTAFDLFTSQGITSTSISNIVERAGVAKGTFYLYFKDKYDLRDRLIRHKASEILGHAYDAMNKTACKTLEDKVIFLAGHILGQLQEDKLLLRFINKNLSWGLLKHEMANISPMNEGDDINLIQRLQHAIEESPIKYKNPEVLLYMIVELVGSTCYSSILENDPLPITELRPYLMDAIRAIIKTQEIVPEQA